MNKELSKYLFRLWVLSALLLHTVSGSALAASTTSVRFSGGGTQTHTTSADFNQACANPEYTRITQREGEGVELAAQFSDSFTGTTLDTTTRWDEGDWGLTPITPTVSGGLLTLPAAVQNGEGSWVRSQPVFTHGIYEATGNFNNGAWQHLGFANTNFAGDRYFFFSTYTGDGNLYARVNNSTNEQSANLGPIPTGLHAYRIEWAVHPTFPLSDTITFYFDDVQVANFVIDNAGAVNFHAYISNDGLAPLSVDNAQVMPSYAANGTYESCILDAGDMHAWESLNWNALTPISGTVGVETRSSIDRTNWSNWTQALTSTGSAIAPLQRYAQYRLTLTTTDVVTSPLLEAISLNYSPSALALLVKEQETLTATIGSSVKYALNVTVPQTQTHNLIITHTLPAGLKYDSLAGVATAGITGAPSVSASAPNDGSVPVTVQMDFSNLAFLVPTASITIPVVVANVASNQAGQVLTATTSASYRNEANVPQLLGPLTDALTLVEPTLTISKTVSSVAAPFNINRLVQYQVVVAHPGGTNTSTAYDVRLNDIVPGTLTLQTPVTVSVSGGVGGYTTNVITNSVAVTITSIPAGGTVTLNLAARLNSGVQPAQIITNTADVFWTSRPGPSLDERTGVGGVNDYDVQSSAPATVQMPDVTLAVWDGDVVPVPGVGGPLTYTLTYSNVGNYAASGVVITETIPVDTTFNAALSPAGWNCVASTCTYTLGTVAAGFSGTVNFVVTLNPLLPSSTLITNTASIGTNSANGPEATLVNNSATEVTQGFFRLFLPLIAKAP